MRTWLRHEEAAIYSSKGISSFVQLWKGIAAVWSLWRTLNRCADFKLTEFQGCAGSTQLVGLHRKRYMSSRYLGLLLIWWQLFVGASHGQGLAEVDPPFEEFAKGVQAFNAGDLPGAKRIWEDLLMQFPQRPELLNNLAVLSVVSGDSGGASLLLAQALKHPPAYASVHANWKKLSTSGELKPELALIAGWPRSGVRVSVVQRSKPMPPAPVENLLDEQDLEAAEERWLAKVKVNALLEHEDGGRSTSGIADDGELGKRELELALLQWKADWASRDVAAYLKWYSKDFAPAGGMSLGAWEAQRRAHLVGAKRIAVQVDVRRVEPGPLPNSEWIHMVQHYSSKTFADVTLKSMLWVRTPAGWQILRETAAPYRAKRAK
jgi:hypothetical protein